MEVKATRKIIGKGTRDNGGCEFSCDGKLRTYQKYDKEPGPVKTFTKEEIAEYQKGEEILILDVKEYKKQQIEMERAQRSAQLNKQFFCGRR